MNGKRLIEMLKTWPGKGKRAFQNAPLDFHFATWLVGGALVLAVVSWCLPTFAHIPMTADMRGTVAQMYLSHAGKRTTYTLKENVVAYTIPTKILETLSVQPQVGDQIIMKYEITSLRDIKMLKLVADDGSEQVLYWDKNPALQTLYRNQWIAFGAYGLFAAGCVVVYRRKKRQGETKD